MGTFLGTMLIYYGGHLLTVALIIILYPKMVLDLGTEGVPVPLVHLVRKNI